MNANNALPTLEELNSKEQLPTIEELNNEQSLPTLDELNSEESLPTVEELNGKEELPTLDELNGEAGKEDIGVFERIKLEKEAQLGKKLGTVEAIAAHTPVVRHLPEMEAARQESVEQRLYEMQVDNSLEMVKLAKSIGIEDDKIQEIVDEADSGKRTIGGFKRAANVPLMKERFRALVEPRMVERIKARQEARERLKNAKELGTWGEIGKGALQMVAPLAELTNPLTIATEAGASVVKRTGRMGHNIYTLDENSKPVIAKDEDGNELRGERGEMASVKALAGAAADAAVWVTPVVGKIIKTPLKLIANKTPGLNAALAGAAKGSIKALEKAQAKLETSAAGRLLLKTYDALGKLDDKVHFGSLPKMMAKSRVSEFLDNVVGLGATPEEREKFGEWVERITSAEDNLNLFLGMVGAWGVTAAATGGKVQLDIRRFRKGALEKGGKGREAIVGEFIGEDAAKKLSNEDLDYMARVISSKGLTVEKVDELMDQIRTDKAETAARIDAGQTPDEVLAAWRAGRGDTSAVERALKGLKGELEERRMITPEMEQALDERIALYSDGQESVARAIKEDFRKNLTDNKVFDDADQLDEMVAMSARKFEPETRRLKIHDLRGSAMTEAEKVVGIKDLGIETVEDAEREGLVSLDQYGRLTGGATEALKIVVHGTERTRGEVAEGRISGRLASEIIDFAEMQMGSRERADRTELIDSILDNAKGDESTAKAIMARLAEDDGRGTVAERVAKATIAVKEAQLKARHPDADGETVRGAMVEPVETADGRMTTLAETMDVKDAGENGAPQAPQGALEGVEQAARTKATKLEFAADGAFRCAAFPELAVKVSSAGVELNGFTPQGIADPAKAAEVAAVLAQAVDVARRNGVKIVVDEVHRPVVEALLGEIKREGLAKTQAKLDTRAKLFSLLFKTTLGNGVTYDEASFRKALEETSNGRRFIDNHGDIYGLVDGNNVLHFNPGAINFNTPIHEYGHLALDTIKGINRKLWQQGMDLIKDSEYYRDIERQSNDAESPYAYMKGRSDDICDEALATLIGDRGEKLVLDKGLETKLKEWLKEVWKAFKGAFGLGDLSDEQVEKMTLDEFVNVVNAELLSGREFGAKKKAPVTERSVKRYDESDGSGSNGLLRWRNDRGYLFAIPVDMERTQPGGKVVFATDDADITDYIQLALNGIELRLSKSGKIYIKGRNGLPAELAEIFGKYPTIGQNDGIREELASALGNGAYANATVAELVDALKADRANYDEWVKAQDKGKSLEDQRQEAHYADEAAREEAEARERWENSGMGVLDYIRSRAEEGVPEFDLDWEIAREMARDFEEGRFAARPAMSALAKVKVGESVEGVTADSLRNAIKTKIENGIQDGEFRFKKPEDKSRLVSEAVRFYKRFSQKTVMLSDGRCVYFVPDARAKAERGLSNDEAWAEYAIHAVTSSGQKIPGKSWNERLYNKTKAANIWRIENILKAERCEAKLSDDPEKLGVVFFGRGVDGRTIQIITRLDDRGNILADLSEVTVITGKKEKNLPPHKPLAEAVEAVAHKLRGGLLTVNENILPQNREAAQGHFSVGGRNDWKDIDLDIFEFRTGMETTAMGETEQSAAGLAGAREQREALRPWTKPQSPADLAKPIAFDAADLILFWRAVSGSLRNPHVQKGKRIAGRKGAIGLNIGGDRIEIVSRLFGVLDEGDRKKLMEECRADGFFRNEDADWCAARDKSTIAEEEERSRTELARRTAELYKRRVETGEGGEHYAAQVLAHEIGHTLGALPTAAKLGPVGEAARTLYEAMTRELKRKTGGTRKVGEAAKTIKSEVENLIAWWHGQEQMPEYYAKDKEMFAELFGIFLTQPESVQAMAPRAYDTCVKIIAGNEKLAAAYRKMSELKWSGAANDRVMAEVRKTWDAAAQRQYRELNKMTKESISLKRDWFNFALNDRFGPMFAISRRSLAAEKKRLQEAVKSGDMSEQEAADRIKAKEDEINALKTSLYNWQRQSGGQTRLMIAGFDDVRAQAEREGVSWSDVRDFAHNMRVIELGGRATAHGITPARAAVILEEMKKRLGSAAYSNVEKTWKAFRAVYERSVLDDPNVRELFSADTMKMLEANKHYVTMRHRMGVEEAADWEQKIKEYRAKNSDAWDPCIDIQERLNKGLGATAGEGSAFVLHHLVGSFEATEDPIAATIRRAIEIKESAARNHLIKQTSETLRMMGAKGVYDTVAGTKPAKVDPNVYGKLTYMDGGEKHELIVPRVVYQSFKADPMSFGAFGAAMRTIRNTMTLWNPMFVNRAYLIDRAGLETNIKGLHKAPIDILSEAFSIRGIGVPLYMVNNYLARFTPICNSWLGKLLWNENTVNHYAHRAQKIASIVYEGRFGERLEEAKRLRELGETGKAQEIEDNLAIAQEMLKRNVFQSAYRFNKQQAGFDTDEIMRQFGYRIEGGTNPRTWRAKVVEGGKTVGRWWTRYGEEQEAVTKIIAYLYEMKKGAAAEAAARTTIEMGGTPNLAARGVWASYVENATGFFWNVRKEASLRTIRAIKDHPTEWIVKNFAQTAVPAVLKGMMLTGALEMLIRNLFDDDEEKVQQSWWAAPVINHARFMNEAMKCVPGYHQRNYNVIPLAKFGDEVLSMRVKYSPEEFAIQNLVHTMFQKFGADPTDPDADFTTLNKELLGMFSPDVFGRNYALDLAGVLIGPMVGFNPYDSYRQRNVYDQTTWEARWSAPGNMATEIVKNFWNYSPLASFTTTFKNNQERKIEDSDVPAWLDAVLSMPVIGRLPASMLSITSGESYLRALERVDKRERAYARLKAADVLEECIKRGRLGGFEEGLKELSPELQRLAIRHVINGWRRYHMDPRAENLRKARNIKDPKLRIKAQQWIEDGMKFGD